MNFEHDLAEISRELMRDAGINVSPEWDDCYACIKYLELHHRWFDSSIPYKVVYSKELQKKLPTLSIDDQQAIADIVYCLENCVTITPYMSKALKHTAIRRSDFFLKNWDIYHLHLEKAIPGKPFTKSNLLFFQRKGQVVHLIDVRNHPKGSGWFVRDLLEIVYDNWPWLLRYIPKCIPVENIGEQNIHNALKNAIIFVPFRQGMLMPTTLGVASSGDSIMAVKQAYSILNRLRDWENELKANEDEIQKSIWNELSVQVTEPLDYELITENGYFVAYEIHSNAKIKLFEIE